MPSSGRPSPTALLAGRSLMAEVMAAEVCARLEHHGTDVLLIKGPVLDQWLYGGEVRRIGDLDLVVDPRRFADAERALRAEGFVNRYDGIAPAWVEEHADVWSSDRWPLPVDLHRRLWGFEADPAMVWDRLWAERESLELAGGARVWTPGPAPRALLVALHAAHHETAQKSLEDMRRALRVAGEDVWRDAAALARGLGSLSGLVAGLELVPGGSALRDTLGLGGVEGHMAHLHTDLWSAPPTTEGFLRFADAPGLAAKLSLLRRELLPSPTFMRRRSLDADVASRGPLGLALSYARRWLRLARHARAGIRSARRMRAGRR